jgi:hypothetical protein
VALFLSFLESVTGALVKDASAIMVNSTKNFFMTVFFGE